ncbi:MAG: hypothetical protein LBG67_04055 [Campylobacteraceae bacterium]|jgi:protein subunit release factor A|nr:hypothetical protein [Campylobacteraceae bacterium]
MKNEIKNEEYYKIDSIYKLASLYRAEYCELKQKLLDNKLTEGTKILSKTEVEKLENDIETARRAIKKYLDTLSVEEELDAILELREIRSCYEFAKWEY